MKIHVRQLSFDGEHWWDVQDPNWIVDVDELKIKHTTDENPMKAVETKKLPTKKIFGNES